MSEKTIFVKDLQSGQRIVEAFAVVRSSLAETRTGKSYINAEVMDSTGSVMVRIWDASQDMFDGFPAAGGYVRLCGRVDEYNGQKQLVVDDFEEVPEREVQLENFLPSTTRDIDSMWSELVERLGQIEDADYAAMAKAFVNNERFARPFRSAPAASGVHHAYVGGLLEHTLGLMRAAEVMFPLYPRLNADLVRLGVLMHDVAKIAEYEVKPGFGKTRRRMLLGHISMGTAMARHLAQEAEAATGSQVPALKLELLQHMILAHHGQLDFGSPVIPAIPEAWFLHYIDNLDAKLNTTYAAIDHDTGSDAEWTAYHRLMGTRFFKKSGCE